jgi:hypothetical protein
MNSANLSSRISITRKIWDSATPEANSCSTRSTKAYRPPITLICGIAAHFIDTGNVSLMFPIKSYYNINESFKSSFEQCTYFPAFSSEPKERSTARCIHELKEDFDTA